MSQRRRIEPEYLVVCRCKAATRAFWSEPDNRRGKGMGADRDVSAGLLELEWCRRRCGADWTAGRLDRGAARQDVHVLDRVTTGPKPALVEGRGPPITPGRSRTSARPDIVIECTGVVSLILDAAACRGSGRRRLSHRDWCAVVRDAAVSRACQRRRAQQPSHLGFVNANRRHYYRAAKALAKADPTWLQQLVTRRVPPDAVVDALVRERDDIKVVIEFGQ